MLFFLVLMTCGIAGAWAEELTKEQALENYYKIINENYPNVVTP